MKKIIAMLLVLLLTLSCFAACGSAHTADEAGSNGATTDAQADDSQNADDSGSDLAFVQDKGKLVVGITDYAPMDYKDDNGEWTGFDAEFARLFAEELGVECEFFVLADWGKKIFELDSKNIDCVWNGMTITEEILLTSSVSDPYVINAQVVVMKSDVVGNYTDVESMKDLTFAVESGSAGEACLNDAGLARYVAVQDQGAAVMEVAAGTSDACVIDITMANAMTGEGTSYADLSYNISLTEEEYGVSFRKDSDLTAKFNEFMAQLKADGTLQELAAKYQLTLAE